MAEITIRAETVAEVRDLLAGFARSALITKLSALADAIEQGRLEQHYQSVNLQQLLKGSIMISIDQILENVKAQRSTVDSVAAFITGLEGRLADAVAGADPATQAKLQTVLDELNSQKQALADAIDSDPNTPPSNPAEPA